VEIRQTEQTDSIWTKAWEIDDNMWWMKIHMVGIYEVKSILLSYVTLCRLDIFAKYSLIYNGNIG
jgi:hypothetical protein